MSELISCILVTANRNHFLPYALHYFAAQTYPHRELIVVDDGEIPVADLCAGQPLVQYIRLDRRTPTGAKLNLGIELASGTILQKIDDDDYYAPGFLATAVAHMEGSSSRDLIAGWDSFLIFLASAARPALYYSGTGWLAGGTLSFRRAVWDAAPFRDVAKNEDWYFTKDHPGPRLRITSPEQYVLIRHGRNTWKSFHGGDTVDSWVRTLDRYPKSIAEIVGEESARFYAGLRRLGRPATA